MSEDVNELQKEWRAIVLNNQSELRSDIALLRKDIADLKGNYVPWTEYNETKKEVEKLKLFKSKFVGIIVTINAAAAVIGWGIQTYLYWHNSGGH